MGTNVCIVGSIIVIVFLIRELSVAYQISQERVRYMRCHEIKAIPIPNIIYRGTKRMADIILSVLVCLIILPILYIVLGVIIKLTSKGTIIFKQKRVGLFGKTFTCYKFRSMYINSGDKIVFSSDDTRVTPIGRFIRKTHLDEFPQFFNVLKGNMSLVGPRPLPCTEVEKIDNTIEVYTRCLVRPGITGLAQVNSGRFLSTEKYLHYDLTYVSKLSLIKDIKLLWQTLKFSDKTC